MTQHDTVSRARKEIVFTLIIYTFQSTLEQGQFFPSKKENPFPNPSFTSENAEKLVILAPSSTLLPLQRVRVCNVYVYEVRVSSVYEDTHFTYRVPAGSRRARLGTRITEIKHVP